MFKCDIQRTKDARKAKEIRDRRSYWGVDGHEYLFGVDRSARRHELFVACKGICFICGRFAPEDGPDGTHGELHHRGCYCLKCIEWRCGQLVRACHRHRTPGFQKVAERKADAIAAFEKLYDNIV